MDRYIWRIIMTDAINTNNQVKPQNLTSGQRAKANTKTDSGSTESVASTIVELSSSRVMEEMQRLPDVDQGKVESIKSALANGDYKPDPEVIARQFSEIENLLP